MALNIILDLIFIKKEKEHSNWFFESVGNEFFSPDNGVQSQTCLRLF